MLLFFSSFISFPPFFLFFFFNDTATTEIYTLSLHDALPICSACKSSSKTQKFKLGLPREFFLDLISADVLDIFHAGLHSLCSLGARIEDVSIPLLEETEDAGNQIAWPEATQYHKQAGWFPTRA